MNWVRSEVYRLDLNGDGKKLSSRGSRTVLVLSTISLAVLLFFFIRSIGTAAAVFAASLLVIMELLLIRWITRDTSWGSKSYGRARGGSEGSRMLRKMNISSNSLKGRAYSQQMILSELKSILTDRIRTVKMISSGQLSELAKEQKASLFGSELLYRLYRDDLMERRGKRLLAKSSDEFVRLFNNIVTDLRKNN